MTEIHIESMTPVEALKLADHVCVTGGKSISKAKLRALANAYLNLALAVENADFHHGKEFWCLTCISHIRELAAVEPHD